MAMTQRKASELGLKSELDGRTNAHHLSSGLEGYTV